MTENIYSEGYKMDNLCHVIYCLGKVLANVQRLLVVLAIVQ